MKKILFFLALFCSSAFSQVQWYNDSLQHGWIDTSHVRPALGTLAFQSGTFSGTHSGTSSGTNTGDQTSVSGNAGTATALQNARTINGVSFDGTGNITVTASAGTLTSATLNSTVVNSSLTSFGSSPTIVTPSITTGFTIGGSATSGKFIVGNGTNFVASTPTIPNTSGTTGQVLTSDGTNITWGSNPIGIVMGGTTSTSSAYISMNSGGTASTATDPSVATNSTLNKAFVAPFACTLYNFTAQIVQSATACNITMTIRVNGSDATPAVTVTNVAGRATDGSGTVALAAGDLVCIHYVLNSGTYNNVVSATALLRLP